MLRTTFILFLLFSAFITFSQVNIINRSLTDSSLSVAYIGVENAIDLVGLKNNSVKLSFTTTNGTMSDIGQGRYILRPEKAGECIISFRRNGKNVATKTFKIDTLYELKVRIAGVRDSIATIQEITTNPFLIIEAPKSFYKVRCIVRSFVLSMDEPSFEDSNPYEIVGNVIPSHVIKRIKELRKGDWMWFDQIIMNCADCRTRKLPPFKIIIHTSLPSSPSLSHQPNIHQIPSGDR
jgi:hypothetical protein